VEAIVVRITAENGMVGYGEAPPTAVITGDTKGSVLCAIREHIAPALTGMDILALEEVMERLHHAIKGNTSAKAAVDMARKNAVLNGLDGKMDFLCADVFDLLPRLVEEKRRDWDFIILDPPAFTKSRRTADQAARGYKEINYRAMRLLPRGGYLATCSCSHFATPELFEGMLRAAAQDAGVQLRQIEARQQSPDHPILWNVPETNYLKFYLFQVV